MKIKDLPLGAKIIDPNSKMFGKPIVWMLVAKDHYNPNEATLMSEKILKAICVDALEKDNPGLTSSYIQFSNPDYETSNIHQWMNNSKKRDWYSPAHKYDAPPIISNMESTYKDWDYSAGFLNGLSMDFRNQLKTVTIPWEANAEYGGGMRNIATKVFIPSIVEMGLLGAPDCSTQEGRAYAYFTDNEKRKAYITQEALNDQYGYPVTPDIRAYWTRTASIKNVGFYKTVVTDGTAPGSVKVQYQRIGFRPALNVSSNLLVKAEGTDNTYLIDFDYFPSISGRDRDLGVIGRTPTFNFHIKGQGNLTIRAKIGNILCDEKFIQCEGDVVIGVPGNVWSTLPMRVKQKLTIEVTDSTEIVVYRFMEFTKTEWLPAPDDTMKEIIVNSSAASIKVIDEQKVKLVTKLTECNISASVEETLDSLVDKASNGLAEPNPYPIYTVVIDLDDPNPNTRCTYADDAKDMIPMNYLSPSENDWANKFPFNQIRPCVFDSANYTPGKVPKSYVKPNNYRQYLDSTTSISSNDDVMVEFPRFFHRVKTIGRKLYVSICEVKSTNEFNNFSHLKPDGTYASRIYIGAYLTYASSSKAYSQYGKTLTQTTISTHRTNASARGAQLMNYYMISMLQLLYVMAFKTTSTQKYALGNITTSSILATGTTDAKGMYFTHDNGKQGQQQMKIFGVEDLWGNYTCFTEGTKTSAGSISNTVNIHLGYKDFSSSTYPPIVARNVPVGRGRITDVLGNNVAPFWPIAGQPEVANWATGEYFGDGTFVSGSASSYKFSNWCSQGYGPSTSYYSLFTLNEGYSDDGAAARIAFVPNY